MADIHIDFGPHPKRVLINTRLDREPSTWEQPAIVMGFVVVHVHTVPVYGLAEAVTRSVYEILPETSLVDDRARRSVNFPATEITAIPGGVLDQ